MNNVKIPIPLLVIVAVVVSACGGGEAEMPPAAVEGRQVALDQGCAACHGADGQGSVGPAWIGLFGSEVELADGSVVTADRAYLRRAITDPQAEMVAGFTTQMPQNQLTDAQVDAVVAYIEHLGASE